ncbi:hypothetical protein BJV77DRAFT_119545 [Russula vinacea]|nr:hypothetical protein BJV77DRAFT_119545 [Russula vinacea]
MCHVRASHASEDPTIMRLSILALFVALPTVAYAVLSPQQRSAESGSNCVRILEPCINGAPCCGNSQCVAEVRLSALTLIYVEY